MKAKDVFNFKKNDRVLWIDKNGYPCDWASIKDSEVIGIEFTSKSINIFVDYCRNQC